MLFPSQFSKISSGFCGGGGLVVFLLVLVLLVLGCLVSGVGLLTALGFSSGFLWIEFSFSLVWACFAWFFLVGWLGLGWVSYLLFVAFGLAIGLAIDGVCLGLLGQVSPQLLEGLAC